MFSDGVFAVLITVLVLTNGAQGNARSIAHYSLRIRSGRAHGVEVSDSGARNVYLLPRRLSAA